MERITMNTQSLQEKFPEVYRDFFARNDLVVSGEYNFPWGSEAGRDHNKYLRIKTTIPLKCYIGINITDKIDIIFKEITFFDINKKIFESISYDKVIKEYDKIKELLLSELSKKGIQKGLKIEILSETARGHGFGFSGTSGAIISYCIYVINNFIQKKDLSLLINDFDSIFALSGKIDYFSRYGDTFGHNTIFTLKPNSGVSTFFTETIEFNDENIDKIEDLKYEFKNINKDNKLELPLDYYIIFSGLPTDTKQVEYFKKLEFNDDNTFYFVNNEIFKNENNYYLNYFSKKEYVNELKLNIVSLQNIKTLECLYNIFLKPHDQSLIESLINQINNMRFAVNFIEKQNKFADDFIYFFRNNITHNSEILGICPSYSGSLGGSYIIVTKPGISRKTIEYTISNLKSIYSNIEIEYSSHRDGTSQDGIIIEQFISNGFYSKYVDKNKVIYKDNKGKNYLGDYSDIIFNEKDGLIFDMISNKIFFNGEKLTSKDIPSQNTTIEVVNKLLENINEEISNKDLPISSYTGNKNEMLGKIILPLLKFIELKTGEKLQIVCKGSITDFFIKMGNINLKIGTIKKI